MSRAPDAITANAASRPFSAGRFCLRFLALLAVAFAAPLIAPLRHAVIEPWNRALSVATAAMLRLLGFESHALAGSVIGPGIALEVIDACNGLDAIAVFGAALVALGGSVRRRMMSLLIGAVTLLLLNLVRLTGLSYVAIQHPTWLAQAHYYVGQSIMILASVLLWIVSIRWVLPAGVNPRSRS